MNYFLAYRPKFTSPNIGGYRYFFNGQEGDNEVFGEVANFGYEFRQYDSRLARWWGIDPKWNEYSGVSPYVFCNGSPIMMADLKGLEEWIPEVDKKGNVTYTAEKGDNYQTFVDQFYCFKKGKDNKLHDKSIEIFKNANYKEGENAAVKEGDVISGKAVFDALGSDILKGNWNKMTDNQKAYQIKFALDYGKARNSSIGQDYAIDLNDFINGFTTRYDGTALNNVTIPHWEGDRIVMMTVNIRIWPKNGLENSKGQIPIYWAAKATGVNYNTDTYYSAKDYSAGGKIRAITITY